MEQGKNTWRQTARGTCPNDCSANQLRSAGCAGWLDTTEQPAAKAASGSPPATENASGKLLAPKTTTTPSGWKYTPQVGGGAGAFGREARCQSLRRPRSLANRLGKETKLPAGPRAFARSRARGSAGLLVTALQPEHRRAPRFRSDLFQETKRALRRWRCGKLRKRRAPH